MSPRAKELTKSGLPAVHMRRRRKDVWIETNDPKGGSICFSIETEKATEAHRELVRKVNALMVEFLVSTSPPVTLRPVGAGRLTGGHEETYK